MIGEDQGHSCARDMPRNPLAVDDAEAREVISAKAYRNGWQKIYLELVEISWELSSSLKTDDPRAVSFDTAPCLSSISMGATAEDTTFTREIKNKTTWHILMTAMLASGRHDC